MTDTRNTTRSIHTRPCRTKNQPKPPRNQWLDVWDQFKKHKGAVFGGGFFVYHACSPAWAIHMERRPTKAGYPQQGRAPHLDAVWDSSAKTLWHRPFGTDNLGRDMLAQHDRRRPRINGCGLDSYVALAEHRHSYRRCCRLF